MALEECRKALAATGGDEQWIVFSNLAFSYSPTHQSDELDLLCIGPRGVVLIEVKHWDPGWITGHFEMVEREAEKLTQKAKRLAGFVRKILPGHHPKVEQWLLLTRDPSGAVPDHVRGVPVRTLRSLQGAFKALSDTVLSTTQIEELARALEPRAALKLGGKIRKLGEYVNLELCSPPGEQFHRVYKGIHKRTKERVVLHLYDLSAGPKNARPLAEREFRTIQLLQKCRYVPRIRDSFQDLPGYPGEMCFFTLFDPGAASVRERTNDKQWHLHQRAEFAVSAFEGLAALHGLTDPDAGPIVHRNITPDTLLVGARNQPLFTGFHLAHTGHRHGGQERVIDCACPVGPAGNCKPRPWCCHTAKRRVRPVRNNQDPV